METAPISVRVARWTAVAAGITALGSLFQTVWTEKPWWIHEKEEPVHVSSPAPVTKRGAELYEKRYAQSEKIEMTSESPVMSSSPAKTTVSLWSWIGISAIVIALIAVVSEWLLRKKHSGNTVPPWPLR